MSSVEGREKGFKEVMTKEFPNIKVLGPDYNLDDPNKAAQQTAAVLARNPISRRVRHQRVQRRRAPAPRSSTQGWAAMCRLSPTTRRSRRSN